MVRARARYLAKGVRACSITTVSIVMTAAVVMGLVTLALDIGRIFPTDLGSPSGRLVSAARNGDYQALRRCFLDNDISDLDLDSALDAAAAHSHLRIVQCLVEFGASDLESALLSSVVRDNVRIAAYLVSKERTHPATNTRVAQTLAAGIGAINCDWFLTAHRWGEMRSPS